MNGFGLLVFDWDGTLMDSEERIVSSVNAAIAELGLPSRSRAAIRDIIGLGLPEAMQALYPGLGAQACAALIDRYRDHFLAEAGSPMPLFPGAAETLATLRAEGFVLAVATGKSRRGLSRAFDQTGLGTHFESSRCADETHPKPHPAMLLELAEELSVAAERIVMIGDTTHDLEMAAAAGSSGIGVTYGAHPREQLAACEPLLLAASVGELRRWLQANG